VRIRPGERITTSIVPRPLRTVVHAIDDTQLAVDHAESRHQFSYDRVYGEGAMQADMYAESVAPLVQQFLSGHNVTVFAYGQTSSGKSYSMGTADVPQDQATAGIIPRAAQHLISELIGSEYSLSTSFIELYNEDLIDLLTDPDGETPPVQIRENRGQIIWAGVRQQPVDSADMIVECLRRGMVFRQTHQTEMNTHSSRSHAIFTLTLRRGGSGAPATPRRSAIPVARMSRSIASPRRLPDSPATISKLHFVDLAGSERLKRTAATGDRAREGIAINAGLHALGNVISTLSDPSRRIAHIPYRDSKLTRLLQDSLGGNAYTLMIACVSPLEANVSETLNTLHYAQRARHIRNTVVQNVVPGNVEELQAEVQRLRLVLAEKAKQSSTYDMLEWQQRCSALSQENVRLTAELVRRERQPKNTDDFLAAAEPIIVEYEKTVDTLESQITLMKAALAHSEELISQRDKDIAEANDRCSQTSTQLAVLRDTVHKLTDRLAERTRRIDQLEAQSSRRISSLGQRRWSTMGNSAGTGVALDNNWRRSFGGILDYNGAQHSNGSFRVAMSPGTRTSGSFEPLLLSRPGSVTPDMVSAAEREVQALSSLLHQPSDARNRNFSATGTIQEN
jgi:flagellar biosynthesis chaperone FliJ